MANFSANQNLSAPGPKDGGSQKGGLSPAKSCLGCLGIMIAFALLVGGCSYLTTNHDDDAPSIADKQFEAKTACENQVKDRLKSPSTAKFNSDVTGVGPFTVTGTVDSENSFGATLRSSFQCTVKVHADTTSTRIDNLN